MRSQQKRNFFFSGPFLFISVVFLSCIISGKGKVKFCLELSLLAPLRVPEVDVKQELLYVRRTHLIIHHTRDVYASAPPLEKYCHYLRRTHSQGDS